MHLLEEIAALSPARVVIVYHPYYDGFTAWARQVLSSHSQIRCTQATGRPLGTALSAVLTLSFLPQHGPYADITSVINGSDHLGGPTQLYVTFADNLYGSAGPLLALRDAAPGQVAVLASPYRPELAASRGVIATVGVPGQRLMADLAEKPGPQAACAIERRYGRSNLFLLEGRIRLTAAFTEFARKSRPPARAEPKLAVALAEYATSHPVHIVEASEDVTRSRLSGLSHHSAERRVSAS